MLLCKEVYRIDVPQTLSGFQCLLIYLCFCVYVSHYLNKRTTIEIYSLVLPFLLTISKNFLYICFFSKKWSQGSLVSKNCRVTWISVYISLIALFVLIPTLRLKVSVCWRWEFLRLLWIPRLQFLAVFMVFINIYCILDENIGMEKKNSWVHKLMNKIWNRRQI